MDPLKRTFRDALIGGAAAVAGGGKFKNGAITAAFARLFNDEVLTRSFAKRDHKLYLVAERTNSESDYGHAFLGGEKPDGSREAVGFYPKTYGPSALVEGVGEGRVVDDSKLLDRALGGDQNFRVREFQVTARQYYRAMTFAKQFDYGDYGLWTRNCVSMTLGALRYSNVIPAGLPVIDPNALYRNMK